MKDSQNHSLSHPKKILFWFVALALILACVPTAPAPVPTLKPDEINVFIKQTADAASTQTQVALPTSTFTPTFTFTPENTNTPEATLTPISTFVLPTATRAQTLQFFRVKHDTQLAIYDHRSRTATWELAQTPEVVPLFIAPNASTGSHRTILDDTWEYYMDSLNGFDQGKLIYLKAPDTALFNDSGFPKLESLTMGGNIVALDEVRGEWGRVHTMDFNSPGSVADATYTTRPDLVHKFVIVVWNRKTKSTYWTNPPKGSIYWPFVASRPLWIQMDRLEPFPGLPMLVTGTVEQEIKKEPKPDAESTGDVLSKGESVTVVQYHPAGSSVWGRLQGGRWIALFRYTKDGPTYFTTWNMETLPPP